MINCAWPYHKLKQFYIQLASCQECIPSPIASAQFTKLKQEPIQVSFLFQNESKFTLQMKTCLYYAIIQYSQTLSKSVADSLC